MKKIFLFILLAVILAVSIGVFAVLNRSSKEMSQAEKEKALTTLLGRKVNLKDKDIPRGDAQYKGKYLSFSYPASATIYRQLVNGKEVAHEDALEWFSFDMQSPRVIFTVEVIQAPSMVKKVVDYPGVRLRQTEIDMYKESKITASGVDGLVFEKKDSAGIEKTAFFYANNNIYAYSFQSVDIKVLTEVFNKIILTSKFL